MAFCIDCGKEIADGEMKCKEHAAEHAAEQADSAASLGNGSSAEGVLHQVKAEWIPVLKNLFVNPLHGIRQAGSIQTPFFGIACIVASALVFGMIVSGMVKGIGSRMIGVFGMWGAESVRGFDDMYSGILWKVFFFNLVHLALIAACTFAVLKFIYKNREVTFTQMLNGVGMTQAYVLAGLILSYILTKMIPLLGVPFFLVVLMIVPLMLHVYVRENEYQRPAQIFAIPLSFFFVFVIEAIFLK